MRKDHSTPTSPASELKSIPVDKRYSLHLTYTKCNAQSPTNLYLCGTGTETPLTTLIQGAPASEFDCDATNWQEKYCENKIVYARNFVKTSEAHSPSSGTISFSKEEFGALQDSNDVCMAIIEASVASLDESITSPMKYVVAGSSRLIMEVTQPLGLVIFDFVGDDRIGSFGSFSLDTLINPINSNSFKIFAPNYPTIHNLSTNKGSIFVKHLTGKEYEIELNVGFETEDDPSVSIEADLNITMP